MEIFEEHYAAAGNIREATAAGRENTMATEILEITDLRLQESQRFNELSALVEGERVYLRVPGHLPLFGRAEFFLGAALLEAMYTKRTLRIDPAFAVSAQLLEKLTDIQSVYACWNHDLSVVTIEATPCNETYALVNTGSFFSGGVDSAHTLMRHQDELSHLVMLNCFDYDNSPDIWTQRVATQTEYAKSLGKAFCPVETNVRDWTDRREIAWEFAHGLILSSVGNVLGMKKLYIPSSHSYSQLFPWGSHSLTDPMWSTESTQIIHDGANRHRGEKVRDLVNGGFTDHLQVCWKTTSENCGECAKCVRTMVALHLVKGQSLSLPPLDDLSTLKALKVTDENLASQLNDMLMLARDVGDKEIYNRLWSLYRRYAISEIFAQADRYLFHSALKKIHRKLKKPEWTTWRVTLTGDDNS